MTLKPIDCPDVWHTEAGTEADAERYIIQLGDEFFFTGYRCRTCGMETVSVAERAEVEAACQDCGKTFLHIEACVPQCCDDCFPAWADRFIEQQKAARSAHAYPGDCGFRVEWTPCADEVQS